MTHDDHAAIRELLAGYALALDAGDVEECVQLFASDGEFLVYGRTFAGRADIAGMFHEAARGLHLTGSARIEVDGQRATARSQVLFVRAGDLQLRPALYDDELTRIDGRWRFARRRCRFVTSAGLANSPEVSPA
ncbi:nuclear transport factor 2 family protein [Mycobacterium colombiense]|uniref:Nuclear transport factor 2 family protein n=1 Tax=Mycobacterium colombiense TaxID=339268 RepID=A0A329KU38_9MYCO|nr:nuclear transport factor 2 family protein [Mycobacterium colombiense]RAU99077.1 nuclear transport factor 2 family protein [Mycobacterium colombiense]